MTTKRTRTIVEDLEQTLLQFMRKHKITHDEYRYATDILVSSVKAGEESLLYDVFFEAEATDIGNISRQGSDISNTCSTTCYARKTSGKRGTLWRNNDAVQ